MKTLKNSSGYDASIEYFGGADAKAKAMRDAILNTANTEDIYEITGTKYYIKKDMGVDTIPENLQPGDAVLLSPASAAFDKFKNFMVRGRFFKELVRSL